MTMLQLAGPAAETAFRLSKLRRKLNSITDAVIDVGVHFAHYVFLEQPLTERELEALHALLAYGTPAAPLRAPNLAEIVPLFVVPRLGTISPWASKATDIARICGLPVRRVERGRVFELAARRPLEAGEIKRLAPLLHDRMTETLLATPPGEALLFVQHRLKPAALDRPHGTAQGQRRARSRPVGRGNRLSRTPVCAARAPADGRRAHDVRASEFRALPPQGVQRRLADRRTARTEEPVRDDQEHARAGTGRRALGLQGQRRGRCRAGKRVVRSGSEVRFVRLLTEPAHLVMKVETHNHPTAISPFPGAATGSGGEIRDEGATGRGAKPKAGLTGFTVSHLELPEWPQPWEQRSPGRPDRIVSPLAIMLEGPIGAASFNNEFGRPNLAGTFARACSKHRTACGAAITSRS